MACVDAAFASLCQRWASATSKEMYFLIAESGKAFHEKLKECRIDRQAFGIKHHYNSLHNTFQL